MVFGEGNSHIGVKNCGTQYVAYPCFKTYSSQIKQTCIEIYLNGMSIRGILRVTKITHPTIMLLDRYFTYF